jgi:hypothetical protein
VSVRHFSQGTIFGRGTFRRVHLTNYAGLRVKDSQGRATQSGRQSFEVRRWRLDEDAVARLPRSHSVTSTSKHHSSSLRVKHIACNNAADVVTVTYNDQMVLKTLSGSTVFPLSPDHLLDLVQFNALRGLITNKQSLNEVTSYFVPIDRPNARVAPYVDPGRYPGRAIFLPSGKPLPRSLHPTLLQSSVTHATWINVMPFPRMRDNLITWEPYFDHAEFCTDTTGKLFDVRNFYRPTTSERPQLEACKWKITVQEEKSSPSSNGLVLWGEPFEHESWEITPGFIRKWGWCLEGCVELIASSNRRRVMRGEQPIRVSLVQ